MFIEANILDETLNVLAQFCFFFLYTKFCRAVNIGQVPGIFQHAVMTENVH